LDWMIWNYRIVDQWWTLIKIAKGNLLNLVEIRAKSATNCNYDINFRAMNPSAKKYLQSLLMIHFSVILNHQVIQTTQHHRLASDL
jgi:hypothetical protein